MRGGVDDVIEVMLECCKMIRNYNMNAIVI